MRSIVLNPRILFALHLSAVICAFGTQSTWATNKANVDRFPNSHDVKKVDWKGPVFILSQDYPRTPKFKNDFPWTKIDFKTDWKNYSQTVLNYCFEGNIRGGNIESDFIAQNNKVRRWYHAPWLHWGASGREFIHGLTAERSSRAFMLSPTQKDIFQNWAVSFYNEPGGYTLGKVWQDHNSPNPRAAVFPEGTVSYKLLFTEATPDQVPYLEGSPEWHGNITNPCDIAHLGDVQRSPRVLRLLQIDIAVKDKRAKETGWVFGTFVYCNKAKSTVPWRKVIPVGLMWGNDPTVTSSTDSTSSQLKETRINDDPDMPAQHLGWGKRLNGPVDNPRSACISCHQTSQFPGHINSAMIPLTEIKVWDSAKHQYNKVKVEDGDANFMHWFRNLKPGQAFDNQRVSLDDSLQLAVGIQNFFQWKAIKANKGGSMNSWTTNPIDTSLQGYKTNRDGEPIPLSNTQMQ